MQLIVNRITYSDATMVHGEQSLAWNYSAFKKQQGKEIEASANLFEEINSYWAYLDPTKQSQIFNVYVRIKNAFDNTENTKALTATLTPLMTELYSHHDIKDLDHWVGFYGKFNIPNQIKDDEFVENDESSNTRQKTYTKDDYRKLMVMALALRAVVPVWGELVAFTEKHKILGTDWKEYSAYQLLARTGLMYCEAMVKLRTYVNAYIPQDKAKRPHSAIMAGIGSEDYPEWLLGVILFRRVCVGDIRNSNPDSHLVSSIHSYVITRLNPSQSSFIGHVREKNNRREEAGDENKISRLEGYKNRQDLPEGDVAVITEYAKDMYGLARKVSPTTPLELVDLSLSTIKPALQSRHVQPAQLTLMQLVLARAIVPKGLEYLDKDTFLAAMAVTQAVLWHKGHFEIAGLVSAKADEFGADSVEAGMSGHGRIPKELIEELDLLYPYRTRTSSKQQKDGGKTQNVAIYNIDQISKQLDTCGWTLTLPDEWVKVLNPYQPTRRYAAPRDIRGKLAALTIDIAKRSL